MYQVGAYIINPEQIELVIVQPDGSVSIALASGRTVDLDRARAAALLAWLDPVVLAPSDAAAASLEAARAYWDEREAEAEADAFPEDPSW